MEIRYCANYCLAAEVLSIHHTWVILLSYFFRILDAGFNLAVQKLSERPPQVFGSSGFSSGGCLSTCAGYFAHPG
jgi:hypothetical protein